MHILPLLHPHPCIPGPPCNNSIIMQTDRPYSWVGLVCGMQAMQTMGRLGLWHASHVDQGPATCMQGLQVDSVWVGWVGLTA